MQEHPVLAQVALGYSPMIDRQRAVVATRVTVVPERADTAHDATDLIAALLEVWPTPADATEIKLTLRPLDPGAARAAPGKPEGSSQKPVSLNIAGEGLLQAVMDAIPPPHLMLEVPAFMATDPAHSKSLMALREAGSVLLIKGRPSTLISPEVLACFSHSIVDTVDERRTDVAPPHGLRQVTTVQSGARSSADIEKAFERGAVAVLGWPLDDALPKPTGRSVVPTDIQVVMELINGVDRGDPVPRLEAILRRDPTLAFRLLRYLNSPAFGLAAEVSSFGHAIMMLGYTRLKRWLALLLASSSKGANAKPLMHAAVRRGFLMEELGRHNGDAEMRSEMFICGVFSLLDRLMQQPLKDLVNSVPVPERVMQTLLGTSGPYEPYLALVRAVEQETAYDIRECADQLLLGPAEVNRAVLNALRGARQLDG